jgi:hypothetical protein
MAVITRVRFAHDDGALADTLRTLPSLDAVVVPETSTDPRSSVYVFRFDHEERETVRANLERDHTVADVSPMPDYETEHVLGVEFAPDTELLAPEVTSHGGYVLDARSALPASAPRGWHERWLLPDRTAIHEVWQHARDAGFEFEVLALQRGDGDQPDGVASALTDQQRDALRVAYEEGYFREPRDTSLAELAERLELSPSAVSGRIRRGMKALVGRTLAVEDTAPWPGSVSRPAGHESLRRKD